MISMELKELEAVARREMSKHGLHDWSFGFANTKRRLGVCKFQTKRIEIAEYYALHSAAETVLDTLLHEIAHALAGPSARHGPAWKAIAIRLGAIPRACDTSDDAVVKPGDWQSTCPACQKTIHRYRRPKTLNGYLCLCKARSRLVFEYKGDPAFKPIIPKTITQNARWEAHCEGCKTVHLRTRRPKPGIYRCKCPHRCEITWLVRQTIAGEI